MDLGLEGRRAVVTGASRGIGRRIASALAEQGVSVVLAARDLQSLEQCATEFATLGVHTDAVSADLTTAEGVAAVAEIAVRREVDIVINNVGLSEPSRIGDLCEADWQRCFAANFFSSVWLTSACLPGMVERRWGRIVNVSSTVAREPDPWFAHYGAAKAALLSYSKAVAREYGNDGVTCNSILPGIIATDATTELAARAAEATGRTTEEAMARMLLRKPIPAGRLGDADDVAAMVLFLTSERASWISGTAIPVDGATMVGVW